MPVARHMWEFARQPSVSKPQIEPGVEPLMPFVLG